LVYETQDWLAFWTDVHFLFCYGYALNAIWKKLISPKLESLGVLSS
jgi:hypothetical protein